MKTSNLKIVKYLIVILSLFFNLLKAQDNIYGPTLIICSNATGNDYVGSKLKKFNIENSNGSYKIVKVGISKDESVNCNGMYGNSICYNYLDEAINQYLIWNYKHIIILEGEYFVNNKIVIDQRNGSNSLIATGNITIEGEGYSTHIKSNSNYSGNIFEVKSNYNVIKNLRISFDSPCTGILLSKKGSSSQRRVENNLFENIYIGHWNYANVVRTDSNFIGIELNNDSSNIGYNKFKNISLQSLHTGIKFSTVKNTANNINNNYFDDFDLKSINQGIYFEINGETFPQVDYNTFNHFAMQTTLNTTYFVKDVSGNNNYFNDFKAADWGSVNKAIPLENRKIFTITNQATNTAIYNSRLGSNQIHASNEDIIDNGKYTQFFNNYNAGLMLNQIGYNGNQENGLNDKSLTKILGRIQISAEYGGQNNYSLPTSKSGYILTSTDDKGTAIWSEPYSLTLNYNKNIELNDFVLVNKNTDLNAPGLRIDDFGRVSIGISKPDVNATEKLQIDGAVKINGNLNTNSNIIAMENIGIGTNKFSFNEKEGTINYKLAVNGNIRCQMIKAATNAWADFVFDKKYKLPTLEDVEKHINEYGHLTNIPTEKEILENGIDLSKMAMLQMQKIEELTLYIINQNKKIEKLENEVVSLRNKMLNKKIE